MIVRRALKNAKRAVKCYTLPSFESGENTINFNCGKELRRGRAAELFAALPELAAELYFSGELYVRCCDGTIYRLAESGTFEALSGDVLFAAPPAWCAVYDGNAHIPLFSDGTKTYACVSGGLYPSDAPPFDCAVYANERLWTAQGDRLRFSAPLSFEDFTSGKNAGGEIDVPDAFGNIVALVSLENRIFIFREYGIQKLDTGGEQTDFCIEDSVDLGERILKDTIVCGENCIYFCSESSVYKYQGGSVRRLYENFFKGKPPNAIRAAYARGCHLILSARGEDRVVYMFGNDGIETLCGAYGDVCRARIGGEEVLAAIFEGQVCLLKEGVPCRARWQSEWCDLGAGAGEKILERAVLYGRGCFLLRIESGRASREMPVRFTGGRADIPIGLRGSAFRFILETDAVTAKVGAFSCLFTRAEGGKL